MTNLFDRLAPDLDAVIEEFRGEPLRLTPMIGGRISDAVPDPSRAIIDPVIGRIDITPVVEGMFQSRRSGKATRGDTKEAGAQILLRLSPAALAALPWQPRQGDRVERSGAAGPVFAIAAPVVLDRRGGVAVSLVTLAGDAP